MSAAPPRFAPKLPAQVETGVTRDWQFADNAAKNIARGYAAGTNAPPFLGTTLVNYMDAPVGAMTFTSADLGPPSAFGR